MNTDTARVQMVSQQVRTWDVLAPRVLETMAVISRMDFIPAKYRGVAFADAPIPLSHKQQMLPPKLVGRILQALHPGPADSVLEVGTGSGYLTACLANLAGPVHSWDIFDDFTELARVNLACVDASQITLETRDALNIDDRRRYDAIALTASLPVYDRRFEQALEIGGRLFVVVGREPLMEARLVTRLTDDDWVTESLFETVIPAMINAPTPREFVF